MSCSKSCLGFLGGLAGMGKHDALIDVMAVKFIPALLIGSNQVHDHKARVVIVEELKSVAALRCYIDGLNVHGDTLARGNYLVNTFLYFFSAPRSTTGDDLVYCIVHLPRAVISGRYVYSVKVR